MRHYQLPCYWAPGDTTGGTEDVEERFEVLLEANDILLERVVSWLGCIPLPCSADNRGSYAV